MPFEGRQRAAVIERCWAIYVSLTDAFDVPETFHSEFADIVESALISGGLRFTVSVGGSLTLRVAEEYVFNRQKLTVSRYSYNLIDASGDNLFRADNLPFHRTDYRRKRLTHPPHHMHDQRVRVFSFSGDLFHLSPTPSSFSRRGERHDYSPAL